MDLNSVWNTISNWLTGDTTKQLTESIKLTPEDIKVEEIGDKEFVQDPGLLQFQEPIPSEIQYTPDQLHQPRITSYTYDLTKDNTYPCLEYLISLGYQNGMWMINEQTHKDYDVCDEYHGLTFNLTSMLSSAQREAPLFTQSHVGCRCYILCFPPTSISEIPDDAPGLPINGTREEIDRRKELLKANLIQLPLYADSRLNTSISQIASFHTWIKTGSSKKSIPFILPVELPFDLVVYYDNMLSQVLYKGSKGFLLEVYDKTGVGYVYFSNRNAILPLHVYYLKCITTFDRASTSSTIEPNSFVLIDGEIGIVQRVLNNSIYCYLPRFESIVVTDIEEAELLDYY